MRPLPDLEPMKKGGSPMWPFKKKSAFDCSLYKESEKPKQEEKPKMPKEITVRRKDGKLTNKDFGLTVWENEDGQITLDAQKMQVCLLMDIRDRLDILIKKLDKVDTPPENAYNEESFYKAVQDVFYGGVVQ